MPAHGEIAKPSRFARFVLDRLQKWPAVQTELLDLFEYNFLGMGALPIPASLPISGVRDSFSENGNPNDIAYEKRAAVFLDQVIWFTEAITDRKAKSK